MAFVTADPEARSFGGDASSARPKERRRTPLQAAVRVELRLLNHQLARFSDLEAAIRLRALSELEAGLSTDSLCGLAARAA